MKCVLVVVVFTICSVVARPGGPAPKIAICPPKLDVQISEPKLDVDGPPPGVAICPPALDDAPPPGVAICPPHFEDDDDIGFNGAMTLDFKLPFDGQIDPGFALRPDFMLPRLPRPPRPEVGIEPFKLRLPEDDEVPVLAICPSKPE